MRGNNFLGLITLCSYVLVVTNIPKKCDVSPRTHNPPPNEVRRGRMASYVLAGLLSDPQFRSADREAEVIHGRWLVLRGSHNHYP